MITEEQRLARRSGIGGSDIAIILGLSKYKTPYELYLEKKGLLENTQEETQAQYWGNKHESTIREEFALRNNVKVEEPDTIEHPLFDFLKGNLDGWIPELNAVLEIKTASSFLSSYWGEDGTDVIPMEYLVQVAFYCSLMNCKHAYIAVLIGGNDYRQFKYTRDIALETKIIEAACDFWEAVEKNNPPPPINSVDLKRLYPSHSPDKSKPINKDILDQIDLLNETKAKIKQLEETEDKSKFEIMHFMADSEFLVNEKEEVVCTFKTNKKGSRSLLLKKT